MVRSKSSVGIQGLSRSASGLVPVQVPSRGVDAGCVIDAVSKELSSVIDRDEMKRARCSKLWAVRLDMYMEEVCRVGSIVFKWYDGSVYWHNGRYWEAISEVYLERALRGALEEFDVYREDYVRGMPKIMSSVCKGAMMNPLRPLKSIVGFRNGVVDFGDIDSPVMHPFSDRLDILGVLPYDYDVSAVCPRWRSFLSTILDKDQIDILQKFMGLGVVPRNNMKRKVEKTLWLVGSGANGKSVIHDVMEYVFGKDSFSDVSLFNLIKPGDEGARFVMSIAGKIFNYCTEVDSGDISRHEGNFKSLISGERQQARKIGGNVVMIDEIPYLIFNMNTQPSNKTMTKAFERRLAIINFRTTVRESDMRVDLVDNLIKEASGIRNWLIEGYKRLRDADYKFITPTENKEYMMENGQSLMVFMSEKGYMENRATGHDDQKAQWCRASDIYEEYMKWCRGKYGMEPVSLTGFGRDMTRMRYQKDRYSGGFIYAIYCEKEIEYKLDINL